MARTSKEWKETVAELKKSFDKSLSEPYTIKMTWEEFCDWEEFPKNDNNPPMTAEVFFEYKGAKYRIEALGEKQFNVPDFDKAGYFFLTPDFKPLHREDTFIKLLTCPFFDGKSFKDRINEFLFE